MTHFQLPRPTARRWWIPFVMTGMIAASVALAHATASADPARVRYWARCNDIYGSLLCISVSGNFGKQADIQVWYRKLYGPERSVRLYLQSCSSAKRDLVVEGRIKPVNTIVGTKVRDIYPRSCWIGQMRVLNERFVTGELVTK